MTLQEEPVLVTSAGSLTEMEPAISWSAIVAGAFVALAASVVLTLIAAGLGYKLGWGALPSRAALAVFSPIAGAVAIVVQVLAAGLGGYIVGRMRHIWTSAHGDEAHFRDTAHGLVVWAVATIAGLVLAALVLGPASDQLAMGSASAPLAPDRAANISAQAALFAGIGMLLSAFIAAVAARLGGLRSEEMHDKRRA